MHLMCLRVVTVAAAVLSISATASAGDELAVVNITPDANSTGAAIDTDIVITFDDALDPATVDTDSVQVFGRWSGTAAATRTVSKDGTQLTITPDEPFSAGEIVTVMLSHDLAAADGSPMRSAGYMQQFWIETAMRPGVTFSHLDTMTTRTEPGTTTRSYGGVASDLNNDGFLDLTIVNEDSADLRVFMNLADSTGHFAPFSEPTFAVGDRASPSETADFNRDGNTDICVVNINPDTVSILLGHGDGTYGPQQVIDVGNTPRGIAVLDVDGDGDADIINTNADSGNCSILFNDGAGIFSAPTFFEAGISGEWSLMAADMNGDGIGDLVVGGRSSQQMIVNLGNGDGTFTAQSPHSAGGATWMIALGDLDGDGNVDVTSANSFNNVGSILLGDGAGGLGPPTTYSTDAFPLATDVGDVDGDGDLDWVTSSFQGDFRLFLNDGDGTFTFNREFDAPTAASCALCLDIDNDMDLDLALVDELADVLIIQENDNPDIAGDLNDDGVVDAQDLLMLLAGWGPCDEPCPPACAGDVDGNCAVDTADLLVLLANWSG